MVGYHKALECNGAIRARARKGSPALTSDCVWVPARRRRHRHQTDLVLQPQQILQMGQRRENTQGMPLSTGKQARNQPNLNQNPEP